MSVRVFQKKIILLCDDRVSVHLGFWNYGQNFSSLVFLPFTLFLGPRWAGHVVRGSTPHYVWIPLGVDTQDGFVFVGFPLSFFGTRWSVGYFFKFRVVGGRFVRFLWLGFLWVSHQKRRSWTRPFTESCRHQYSASSVSQTGLNRVVHKQRGLVRFCPLVK